MKKHFTWAAAFALTLLPGVAAAQGQPWLADRRLGEGPGIRTGDLSLHPGIAGEVGYDSNYFQRSSAEDEIAAWRFRLTPSLSLKTLSGPRAPDQHRAFNFEANLAATYNELLAADSDFSDEVSEQRHISGTLGLKLEIAPTRPFGGDVYADYTRMVQPSNTPEDSLAFDRHAVRGGLGLSWRPGGGLFDWRLGYEYQGTYFEEEAFEHLDNGQHSIKTRGRWRFLPRTALMYDASLGFLRYTRDTGQQDSTPLRARVGVNGLITNRFALLAMVGWGASFYESRDGKPVHDFDSVIGHGELKWFVSPQPDLDSTSASVGLSSVALGYVRDFRNSYLGDHYQQDRGYLKFDYFLGGVVVFGVEGGLTHVSYPQSYFASGAPRFGAFGENRLDASAFAEYRTSDSFGLNLTGRYNANLTRNEVPTSETDPALTDDLRFNRYEIYLGARWFM